MKTDKESLTVRQDELIKKYGQWLCKKYYSNKHLTNDISQKMREMARLLIKPNENQTEGRFLSLRCAVRLVNFFDVVDAVKHLTGIDNSSKKKATLALKLGYSMQNCLMIIKNEALIKSNAEKIKEVEDTLELFKLNWAN